MFVVSLFEEWARFAGDICVLGPIWEELGIEVLVIRLVAFAAACFWYFALHRCDEIFILFRELYQIADA